MQKLPIGEHFPTPGSLLSLGRLSGCSKQSAQFFLGSNKTVILVGLAFDKTTRTIVDWAYEVVG